MHQVDLQVVGAEAAGVALPAGCTLLHVKDLLKKTEVVGHLFADAVQAFFAAHGRDFLHGLPTEIVGYVGQLWIENRVHLADFAMVLHTDIGNGQHPRRKVLRRGNGALHRIGVETHRAFFWDFVFLHQPFADEPFTEILAHHGLQNTASKRQLTWCRRPLEPFVRRDAPQGGFFS